MYFLVNIHINNQSMLYKVNSVGLDFLCGKVGINMAKEKPKSTFGYSWLELNEGLYVIGSPNIRCLVELSSSGSGFSKEFSPCPYKAERPHGAL
jgi:hypothetical protein